MPRPSPLPAPHSAPSPRPAVRRATGPELVAACPPSRSAPVDTLREVIEPSILWRVPPELAENAAVLAARGESGVRLVVGHPVTRGGIEDVQAALGDREVTEVVYAPRGEVLRAISRHYDTSWAAERRLPGVPDEARPLLLSETGYELDAAALLARLRTAAPRALEHFVTAILVHAMEWGAESLDLDGGALAYVAQGALFPVLEIPRATAPLVHSHLRGRLGLRPLGLSEPAMGRGDFALGEALFHARGRAVPGPAGGHLTAELEPADTPDLGPKMVRRVEVSWHQMTAAAGLVLLAGPNGSDLRHTARSVPHAHFSRLHDAPSVIAAVDAALGGATVLGQVNAPDAAEALALVRELAASPARFAAALTGVLVRRTVRRVCPTCQLPPESDSTAAERFGVFTFAAPRAGPGCPACLYHAYRGSFLAYELVENDGELSRALVDRASARELAPLALPVADRSLQVDAVARAICRETTTAELLRVLPPARRAHSTRHRGLLRAVTQPGPADDADATTEEAPARVLFVHPALASRAALRGRLGNRATVGFAGNLGALNRVLSEATPVVAVLHVDVPGAWARPTIRDLRERGCRVLLLADTPDPARLREAFDLGADEFAGGLEELVVRLGRWLPPE